MKSLKFYPGRILCTFLLLISTLGYSQIQLNGVVVRPTCFGDCDASITLNPSGGTSPYSYVWSNGSTSNALTNLCAGSYTVTVTDAAGGTFTWTYKVRNPYRVKANYTI